MENQAREKSKGHCECGEIIKLNQNHSMQTYVENKKDFPSVLDYKTTFDSMAKSILL